MSEPPVSVVLLYALQTEPDQTMAAKLTGHFKVLEAEGKVKIQCPRRAPFGIQSVDTFIRDSIQGASIVLPLVSADFFAQPVLTAWLEFALQLGRWVALVRLRDCDLPENLDHLPRLPDDLPVRQCHDEDVAYAAIVSAVRSLLVGRLNHVLHAPASAHHLQATQLDKELWVGHLSGLNCGSEELAKAEVEKLRIDLAEFGVNRLDGLVVTGGLIGRPIAAQQVGASAFLRRMMGEFGLTKELLLLVPGQQDAEVTPGWFECFARIHNEACAEAYPQSPEQQFGLCRLADDRLVMLGLNSSWRPHSSAGGIHEQALQRGLASLPVTTARPHQLRIAAWYHYLSASRRENTMGTGTFARLIGAGFRVVLSGQHGAEPFEEQCVDQDGRRLELLAASTTHYNLLCLRQQTLTVHARRRNIAQAGWRKSRELQLFL